MTVNLKLIQKNEYEYWVGDNQTTLIDGDIIFVIAKGEQTAELAILQEEISYKLATLVGGSIKYLIDLNKCGKNAPEARAIWKKLSYSENTQKVAVFGAHPVAKVIASFFLSVTKNSKNRFFKTKEEALQWLKD